MLQTNVLMVRKKKKKRKSIDVNLIYKIFINCSQISARYQRCCENNSQYVQLFMLLVILMYVYCVYHGICMPCTSSAEPYIKSRKYLSLYSLLFNENKSSCLNNRYFSPFLKPIKMLKLNLFYKIFFAIILHIKNMSLKFSKVSWKFGRLSHFCYSVRMFMLSNCKTFMMQEWLSQINRKKLNKIYII